MGYDEALEREKKRWGRQMSPFRRVPQRPRHARAADCPTTPNIRRPPLDPLPYPLPSPLSSPTSQHPVPPPTPDALDAGPYTITARPPPPPLLLHSKPNTATSVLTGRCDPRSIKLASSRPLQSRA